MTTETELKAADVPKASAVTLDARLREMNPITVEERLRNRVSMLWQLLVLAGVVVILQFAIMLKVLLETAK